MFLTSQFEKRLVNNMYAEKGGVEVREEILIARVGMRRKCSHPISVLPVLSRTNTICVQTRQFTRQVKMILAILTQI